MEWYEPASMFKKISNFNEKVEWYGPEAMFKKNGQPNERNYDRSQSLKKQSTMQRVPFGSQDREDSKEKRKKAAVRKSSKAVGDDDYTSESLSYDESGTESKKINISVTQKSPTFRKRKRNGSKMSQSTEC
jgi:hypothetical protein